MNREDIIRMAQPAVTESHKQEPVARVVEVYATKAPTIQEIAGREHQLRIGDFLYTTPPQRKPLTDEEIDDLSRTMVKGNKSVNWLCQAIEAKLKEKNT